MTKIGMLYICTGKYTVFWPEFYRSFEEKFLPGCEKEYFVFTDATAIEYEDAPRVHRIYQEAYPWPYSTLKRFSIFLTQEDALRGMDYLFFFNANLTCKKTVTAEEFLPRPEKGENLLLVQQPGFWNKKPMFYSYDRNPRCTAYIPYNCGRDYVSGGLNGGTSAAFLAMCKELDRRTEQDIRNGVVPLWHDESQLNRYAAERSDYRLLTPAYWYPEGWDMPFEEKISVRDKARYFDVAAVKNKETKQRGFLARKWGAFCENYLPCWYCLRDTLLHKTLGAGR